MLQTDRSIALVLLLATMSLLTGCATPSPQGSAPPAVAQASAGESAAAPAVITGSRIPVKSTEKLVRQIGAQNAQDSMRNLTPNPGLPSN